MSTAIASDGNSCFGCAHILATMADKKPHLVLQYDEEIMTNLESKPMLSSSIGTILNNLAKSDKSKRPYYLKRLAAALEIHPEIGIIYSMQCMGQDEPDTLTPHKELFERYKAEPQIASYCILCLDLIAGRRQVFR